jgi:hypothetical protein
VNCIPAVYQASAIHPRDSIAEMEWISKVFGSLVAPIYALIGIVEFRPQPYHVGFWFLIAVISTLASMLPISLALWAGWGRLADMAWIATVVCRLALVEKEVDNLKSSVAMSTQE